MSGVTNATVRRGCAARATGRHGPGLVALKEGERVWWLNPHQGHGDAELVVYPSGAHVRVAAADARLELDPAG